MFTFTATAELAIRAVARGQFPDFDIVDIAGRPDNVEVKFRDFSSLANSLAHNKHAKA